MWGVLVMHPKVGVAWTSTVLFFLNIVRNKKKHAAMQEVCKPSDLRFQHQDFISDVMTSEVSITSLPRSCGSEVVTRCYGDYLVRS